MLQLWIYILQFWVFILQYLSYFPPLRTKNKKGNCNFLYRNSEFKFNYSEFIFCNSDPF